MEAEGSDYKPLLPLCRGGKVICAILEEVLTAKSPSTNARAVLGQIGKIGRALKMAVGWV